MRGFKAKALRRLALQLETDEPGYTRKGTTTKLWYNPVTGQMMKYKITLPWHHKSRAHKLYKHMKHDLRNGGQ